jgi:hypothetical protein
MYGLCMVGLSHESQVSLLSLGRTLMWISPRLQLTHDSGKTQYHFRQSQLSEHLP